MIRKAKPGKSHAARPLGMDRGTVIVADDFNAPELPALFLGETTEPENPQPEKPAASKRGRIKSRKPR